MIVVLLVAYLGGDSFRLKAEATKVPRDVTSLYAVESRGFRLPPSRVALRRTAVALSASARSATARPRRSSKSEVGAEAGQAEDPDALYKQRENVSSAERATQIWADRLAKNPKDFEAAWKLARARYWLGTHAEASKRKAYLESGIAAGRAAIASAPDRPEGHFWVAANMGALAESFGLRQGLKYRGEIKNELETVLRLDPAFLQGSADRALGRWYYKVPGLFGGSKAKSEEHLRKSLTYNPNSAASLYFLAETLIDEGKKDEARAVLDKLLAAPVDPEWAPEDREFKQKGQHLLATLRGRL